MAGTVIADRIEAASTSQLVIENGVALTPPTVADVNGVQIGTFCRAWVNFNGTGTIAIRSSFNVSSLTDNAVGKYTLNFTNAMPDVNYSLCGSADGQDGAAEVPSVGPLGTTTMLTTSVQIWLKYPGTAGVDRAVVSAAIFR